MEKKKLFESILNNYFINRLNNIIKCDDVINNVINCNN